MDEDPGPLGQAPEQLRGPAGPSPERVVEADDDLSRAQETEKDVPHVVLGLDQRELGRERNDEAHFRAELRDALEPLVEREQLGRRVRRPKDREGIRIERHGDRPRAERLRPPDSGADHRLVP